MAPATLDWNAFLGTFAQSAAAIIGIIAAFLISKILGENEKLDAQTDMLDRLIIKYNHLKSKIAIRRFEWYDKRNIEYDSDLEDIIKKEGFKRLSKKEKLDKLFTLMPELYRTPVCEPALNKRIKEMEPTYITFPGGQPMKQEKFSIPIVPKGLWDNLHEEREAISQLEIESRTMINKFNKVKSGLVGTRKNLVPLRNGIYLQAAAFLLTVVYPLHFMPMASGESPHVGCSLSLLSDALLSFKGLFLIMLCIVIFSVFGYFLFVIIKLQRSYKAAAASLLPEYTELSKYSEYFRD